MIMSQVNVRAIPDELLERFKKLCQQEGDSMSDKIRRWIEEYVQKHWPGNPQLTLERIAGFERPPEPEEVYLEVLCPICGGHHRVTVKCPGLQVKPPDQI